MAHKPDSRPVSGEIFSGQASQNGPDLSDERDIVDAEYETVVGRHKKLDRAVSNAPDSDSSIFGLNILSNRQTRKKRGAAGPAFWLVSAILVCGAFWISGGHVLFASANREVASATSSHLAIQNVRSRLENRGSAAFLFVDGAVANNGNQRVPLPDLIIQVKSVDGSITRYRIAGGEEQIVAGGRYAFSSRVGAPRSGVENVKVIIQETN